LGYYPFGAGRMGMPTWYNLWRVLFKYEHSCPHSEEFCSNKEISAWINGTMKSLYPFLWHAASDQTEASKPESEKASRDEEDASGKKVKPKYMPSILDEWPLPQGDYAKLLQVPGLDHEALIQLQSWAGDTVEWADRFVGAQNELYNIATERSDRDGSGPAHEVLNARVLIACHDGDVEYLENLCNHLQAGVNHHVHKQSYCWNKKTSTCRFNRPQKCRSAGSIVRERKSGKRTQLWVYDHKRQDPWTNGVSPLVSLFKRSNTDFRVFVCDEAGARYALKYVTKGGDMSKKGMDAIDHLTRKNDCSMPMKSICRSAAVKAGTRDIGSCESAMLIDSSIKFFKQHYKQCLEHNDCGCAVDEVKCNCIAKQDY
jgi:hypothetical protein